MFAPFQCAGRGRSEKEELLRNHRSSLELLRIATVV